MKRLFVFILGLMIAVSIGGCSEQGFSSESVENKTSSERTDLDASHMNYELGMSYYNKKDYELAKEKLSKVLPKDSDYDNAQRVLREIETLNSKTQTEISSVVTEDTTSQTTTWEETTQYTTTTEGTTTTSETIPVRDYSEPVFDSAYSTSTLKPMTSNGVVYTYDAKNVLDNNSGTCWCEGASGTGEGETITLTAVNPQNVGKITINNGLCSDRDVFYKNSRVRDCRITLSDGTSFQYTLSGEFSEQPTVIRFNSNMVTTYIRLTILSTYPGSKYSDTCISEIRAAL